LRGKTGLFVFAGNKVIEIGITVTLSLFFYYFYAPRFYAENPQSWIATVYNPAMGIGYIFIAKPDASIFKFLLLTPQ